MSSEVWYQSSLTLSIKADKCISPQCQKCSFKIYQHVIEKHMTVIKVLPPFLQPTYINPLVAVRFSLVGEKQAKIQCRVVSDMISYENIYDPYEGKVIFNLKAVK